MKYTNGLFTFPVRIYDGFSVRKALKREEDVDVPTDADWLEGRARIPLTEFKAVVDYIPRGSSIETVEQEGFDCCAVITHSMGDFICNVSQDEFEIMLNEFADIYYNEIEQAVEEKLAEKISDAYSKAQTEKKPWWRKRF